MRRPIPTCVLLLLCVSIVGACGASSRSSTASPTPPATRGNRAATPTTGMATTAAATATATPLPPDPTVASTSTPDAVAVACDEAVRASPNAVTLASAKPAPDGRPAPATTYVALDGVRDLTWVSAWIVSGRVLGNCPTHGDTAGAGYVIGVEQTFRGMQRDTLVVWGLVDPWGSAPGPAVGQEVLVFAEPNDAHDPRGRLFAAGGPQGFFAIDDGLVHPAGYLGERFTLPEFALQIAIALALGPREHLPLDAVRLDVAPAGPDLPPAPDTPPAGCGGATFEPFESAEYLSQLAWLSDQIVSGTIVEQLPSSQAPEGSPLSDDTFRPLVTDFLVQVEDRLRGVPAGVVRVRTLGGTLGDCVLTNSAGQLLTVGQRLLLFVWTPEPEVADPTYYLVGGAPGVWQFGADGALLANASRETYLQPPLLPAVELAREVLAALAGPPPAPQWIRHNPSALDSAPIGNMPDWPPLAVPTPEWPISTHPVDGFQFSYPPGWTLVAPGTQGSVTTVASYATSGVERESIPDGALRVDVRQTDGPSVAQPDTFAVGPAGYPGTLTFIGLLGDTYHVSVLCMAAGNHWLLEGYFKEPPTLDNPHVAEFFAIAASLTFAAP